MANTKYRLIPEDYKEIGGKKLYRIEALKDFGGVKAGDLGGYIESENNLSHDSYAWVYDNAIVSDNARVDGNAWVHDNAWVRGNAWVGGNARVDGDTYVGGNARVYGYARVRGNACVGDNAWVHDNASWLTVGPIGSRDGFTTFLSGEDGIYVSCGCFYGSISEFEEAVEKTHAGTKYEEEYKFAIALAKSRIATAEVDKDEI